MHVAPASRPRVCFALPGIHYSRDNAYSLCTRPILPYLEQEFEVTLAYRKRLEEGEADAFNRPEYQHLTILGERANHPWERLDQQRYFNADTPWVLRRYQRELQRFAQTHRNDFDFVIEKQWPWIGAAVQAFTAVGVPASLVLEAWWTRKTTTSWDGAKTWVKAALSGGLESQRQQRCRRWSQQASSIITETQEMAQVLREQQYVPAQMPLHVIPNGMNSDIFYPRDRQHCRRELGIAPEATVLSYVGSLGRGIQDPGHLLEALGQAAASGSLDSETIRLYLVGDGWKRGELEAIAQKYSHNPRPARVPQRRQNASSLYSIYCPSPQVEIHFVGRVPQTKAAQYIGAADLCLAPYDLSMFFQNRFTSGSLKVPEYLACGRLIVTTPCAHMEHLTAHSSYGFLVENQVEAYRAFLHRLPPATQRLRQEAQLQKHLTDGTLQRNRILLPWSDIAESYKAVIYEALEQRSTHRVFDLAPV